MTASGIGDFVGERPSWAQNRRFGKLHLDFLTTCPLPAVMQTKDPVDPISVATTLVLAASLLMENTSAELVLPPSPTRQLLAEKVQLLGDTAAQLQVLTEAARAALNQNLR